MALTATAFPTQAQSTPDTQTTNICDRTPQVVDAILERTLASDTCDSVLNSDLSFSFLLLGNKGITSLQARDFDGLTDITIVRLAHNSLTELPTGIFSGFSKLSSVFLNDNALTALSSDLFPTNTFTVDLENNELNALPNGIFSGLIRLGELKLSGNPGAPFRFTLRFEPETLEEDFTAAPVRLVSDKTVLLPITVPLSVTGGRLIEGAPDSLTIPEGSTQSDTVTVLRGEGYFRLAQEEPQLGSLVGYSGIEVVRGPAITLGGIRVKARIFLEGALE